MDRVAFMEEVWTVVQSYGTQSILKQGLNRALMREVLDKLDECEGRLSELLIDSATDESEANSPIKMTPQDDKGEVVYLSRTRRGTMRSKLVIDKINAMKMKLGSRVLPRRVGKTKMDSEISMKAVNSAKRKRVEEVMDLGQGDYQLPGTDKMLTDIAGIMAGIKSTGYKSNRSDCTLTGASLEIEVLSQCGESTMKDFKPSPMNHGKGGVAGQLVPVEYNRLTVSEAVTLRKTGKTKVDSEISMKAVNSAQRKRVEEAMDFGQGDDRLPGIDRTLTDVAMVPPILMAGIIGQKEKD